MRDDLDARGGELSDVAGVVLVHVRDEDVLDGLVGHRLNLRDEVVVELVAQVLGVDEDDALVADPHGAVPAHARHHVEPGLDLLDFHRRRRRRFLALTTRRRGGWA